MVRVRSGRIVTNSLKRTVNGSCSARTRAISGAIPKCFWDYSKVRRVPERNGSSYRDAVRGGRRVSMRCLWVLASLLAMVAGPACAPAQAEQYAATVEIVVKDKKF